MDGEGFSQGLTTTSYQPVTTQLTQSLSLIIWLSEHKCIANQTPSAPGHVRGQLHINLPGWLAFWPGIGKVPPALNVTTMELHCQSHQLICDRETSQYMKLLVKY